MSSIEDISSIDDTFNRIYIPELLELSYHCSQMYAPHHLKRSSSHGCWMILIGCRTDGYWKVGSLLSQNKLVLKKGICDAFCNVFATIPPFPCEPCRTHPTLPTLLTLTLTLTLTLHYRWTHMYHHLVSVGSVDLTKDTFRTDIAICWFPDWFMNVKDRRQRRALTDVN